MTKVLRFYLVVDNAVVRVAYDLRLDVLGVAVVVFVIIVIVVYLQHFLEAINALFRSLLCSVRRIKHILICFVLFRCLGDCIIGLLH